MKLSDIFLTKEKKKVKNKPQQPQAPQQAQQQQQPQQQNQQQFQPQTPNKSQPPTVYPRSFNDVQDIIDMLKSHIDVTVNMVELNDQTFQRVLDLLTGAAYALGAKIARVDRDIYTIVFIY